MSTWEGLLRRARERRGYSQDRVADLLGISQASVSYAERERRPTLMQFERWAAALGYRVEVRLVDVLEEGREDIT